MKNTTTIVAIALAAAAFGYILALHGAGARQAQAQQGAATQGIICRVGEQTGTDVPIILVNTNSERVVAYEYDVRADTLELAGVRPYRYDAQAGPYNNRGPTVLEVQRSVQAGQGRIQ